MTPTFLHRAYGSARIGCRLIGQLRVPFLPEAQLRAMRDQRVRRIVGYAAENVPYYRRLFRHMGIDPSEIRTAEDLDHLPLIDKSAVRQDLDDFVSDSWSSRDALALRTSGSTGVPLTVFHDVASVLDNAAYTERERSVVRTALGGRRGFRTMMVAYAGSTGDEVRSFTSRHALVPAGGPGGRASPEDPIERVMEAIDRFRPDVVSGNGSFLELVFRQILAEAAKIHRPAILLYHGQAMSEAGLEQIENRLGIRVYSRYNAVEAFKIAFTCESRDGFHLHCDLTHVKIVDPSGATLPPGERGEVVISNLVNRATVLLNYRLGDLAALASGACPCGRTLPRLSGIEGRTEEILTLASGRVLHPRAVWSVFKPQTEVLQYQLVQHAAERYEMRLKTADRTAFDRVVPTITARLREFLGADAILEASFHEQLEADEQGKFRTIVPYKAKARATRHRLVSGRRAMSKGSITLARGPGRGIKSTGTRAAVHLSVP